MLLSYKVYILVTAFAFETLFTKTSKYEIKELNCNYNFLLLIYYNIYISLRC